MAAQQVPRKAMVGVDLQPPSLKLGEQFPGLLCNPCNSCPGKTEKKHLLVLFQDLPAN
ncbi:hypothetical protein D3C80_2005570 [compost metagenome]